MSKISNDVQFIKEIYIYRVRGGESGQSCEFQRIIGSLSGSARLCATRQVFPEEGTIRYSWNWSSAEQIPSYYLSMDAVSGLSPTETLEVLSARNRNYLISSSY